MKNVSIAIMLLMTIAYLSGCSMSVTYPDSTIKNEPTIEHKRTERSIDEKIVFEYKKPASGDVLFINPIFEQSYNGRTPKRYFGGFIAKYEFKLIDGYTGDILHSYKTHMFDKVIQIKIGLHDDYPECLEVHISGKAVTNETVREIDFSTKDAHGC